MLKHAKNNENRSKRHRAAAAAAWRRQNAMKVGYEICTREHLASHGRDARHKATRFRADAPPHTKPPRTRVQGLPISIRQSRTGNRARVQQTTENRLDIFQANFLPHVDTRPLTCYHHTINWIPDCPCSPDGTARTHMDMTVKVRSRSASLITQR